MFTGAILSLLLGTILTVFQDASAAPVVNATQVEAYLKQYGHMSDSANAPSDLQDEQTLYREAIMSFQRLVGLPVTGEADQKTLEMMAMPRCAIPDNIGHSVRRRKRRRRYVAQGSKWPNPNLRYFFENTTKRMTADLNKQIVRKAFQFWTNVSTLIATETTSANSANIKLLYAVRAHGDAWPFDGEGGVLAHAFFPDSGGDAHFDDDERWTDGVNSGTNLLQATVHELGHSLGLAHSNVPGSVMAPVYTGYNPSFRLSQDDIDGIRYLYGYKDDQPSSTSLVTSSSSAASTVKVTSPIPSSSPPPRSSLFAAFCSNGTVDAIVYTGSQTLAFQGSMYTALDVNGVMPGYPRLIRQDWPALPDNLDSALYLSAVQETDSMADNSSNSAHLFFFKGNRYWRYTNTFKLDTGYPKLIAEGFPGVPDAIDAGFVWSGNGKTYFIKGEQYYGYTRLFGVDSSYPRTLAVWRGLPRKIDAAFQWSNSRTYFFSNAAYYRFNDIDFYTDAGYPKPIASSWFNCPGSQAPWSEDLAMEQMQGEDQFHMAMQNTSLDSTSTSSFDGQPSDNQTHSSANSRHLSSSSVRLWCLALHVGTIAYHLLRLVSKA